MVEENMVSGTYPLKDLLCHKLSPYLPFAKLTSEPHVRGEGEQRAGKGSSRPYKNY